jgi:hypothetical protein
VQLSDFDKSRVRYHLGYFTVSVPAGDYARLEEAMNTVPDSFFYDKITIQIGRCDTAEKKTEVATSPSTRLETILGDVDRTIRSSNAKEALKVWDEIYLYETNRLAGILYVPNYKDPFLTTRIRSRLGTVTNVLVLSLSRHYLALLTPLLAHVFI